MPNDDPFIVRVPEGATEIDLGPVLRPILWALKGSLGVSDGLPHSWGSRKKLEHYRPDEVSDLMTYAMNALRYNERIRLLNRSVLISYLNANDWVDEDGRGYTFIRSWEVGKSMFDRRGGVFHLQGEGKELPLSIINDVINKLAYEDRKSKLEKLEEILAHANILDRIVQELE